jgi:hypothetical protein
MNTERFLFLITIFIVVAGIGIIMRKHASLEVPSQISQDASQEEVVPDAPKPGGTFVILNKGDVSQKGHAPSGFQGMEAGLFAGDNFNAQFPDGAGVRFSLSFDLRDLPADGVLSSAVLHSDYAHQTGTPYEDLGALIVSEISYDMFSMRIWENKSASGFSCIFADSANGPFSCDVTEVVGRAYAERREYIQFRLQFEEAGDNDGAPDVASFFKTDSNTNEPGIFELTVRVN